MASNVLPQAFFTVPASSTRCNLNSNNKLAFSAAVSRRQFTGGLFSSVCNKPGVRHYRSLFIVRAEENADVEPEVTAEGESGEESVESADVAAEEERPPTPPRTKLGDIMGILNKRAIEASDRERPIPDLRTGDVVEIKLEVPENRRRLSVYKGIVISKQNAGIHTTIRIRRIIAGIGVEIVFPIYSPNIKEIKVLSHRKVRRARLYYLRNKLPRLSTFK